MEINPEIKGILKGLKIDVEQGTLCLLSIYFNLDAERIIPEEIIRKINLTKIVEKDYLSKTLTWNIPLFAGEQAGNFAWVMDWMKPFGEIGGPARKGTVKEVTAAMKQWFAENPEYRKEDVFSARDLYFRTEKPSGKFVKTSHKFILESDGAKRTSALLLWCQRIKETTGTGNDNKFMRGEIM